MHKFSKPRPLVVLLLLYYYTVYSMALVTRALLLLSFVAERIHSPYADVDQILSLAFLSLAFLDVPVDRSVTNVSLRFLTNKQINK